MAAGDLHSTNKIALLHQKLKQLHNVFAGEIDALNRTYVKGINVHARKTRMPKSKPELFSSQMLMADLYSGLGAAARSQLRASSSAPNGGGFNLSQGQVMGDLASMVTRAMKRNL